MNDWDWETPTETVKKTDRDTDIIRDNSPGPSRSKSSPKSVTGDAGYWDINHTNLDHFLCSLRVQFFLNVISRGSDFTQKRDLFPRAHVSGLSQLTRTDIANNWRHLFGYIVLRMLGWRNLFGYIVLRMLQQANGKYVTSEITSQMTSNCFEFEKASGLNQWSPCERRKCASFISELWSFLVAPGKGPGLILSLKPKGIFWNRDLFGQCSNYRWTRVVARISVTGRRKNTPLADIWRENGKHSLLRLQWPKTYRPDRPWLSTLCVTAAPMLQGA